VFNRHAELLLAGVREMIAIARRGKSGWVHGRDELTICAIIKRTCLVCKTVKQWHRPSPDGEPKYCRRVIPHKLSACATPQ
jgi:hypothetical protein